MATKKQVNLMVLDGRMTDGPYFSPGNTASYIDFTFKSGSGEHQIVSIEPDIVKNRGQLKGRMRIYGKLSSNDGDSVILAQRIEFL